MATFLQQFTFSRNVVGGSTAISADRMLTYIQMIGAGLDSSAYARLSKRETNDISSLANYTGLFEKLAEGGYGRTELSSHVERLAQENRYDAWQWLITRSIWHFVCPNGTSTDFNKVTRGQGIKIRFFYLILGLLQHLNSLSGDDRVLYFHELLIVLSKDQNWLGTPTELFIEVCRVRDSGVVDRTRSLLSDLEDDFQVARDNYGTIFNKVFKQTGLFDYVEDSGKPVGIAIKAQLSSVLQARIRHILDHELAHADPDGDWHEFLKIHDEDLPLEVESRHTTPSETELVTLELSEDLTNLCEDAHQDLAASGLKFTEDFVKRFLVSCVTKRFVILTGLSGSGKTKLAEAIATWLTGHPHFSTNPFLAGSVIPASRTSYKVVESNELAVVLAPADDSEGSKTPEKLTTLPMKLIYEWADVMASNGFDSDTSPRTIKDKVSETTIHDSQINSMESHLKACAVALMGAEPKLDQRFYKLVPVGPDWTSGDYVLGYADGLNPENYVRTATLDLLLSANANPSIPHFLILDEMNLSHVERYFAELLSAIETNQPIELFSDPLIKEKNGVPAVLDSLPNNLFIVGTVNVDETTFLFSPKVLDRANVLEFRVSSDEITDFLLNPTNIDLSVLAGKGAKYTNALLASSHSNSSVPEKYKLRLQRELELLFTVLERHGGEFGYRVANEISRFVGHYIAISGAEEVFYQALDAQVLQKLLPKLHGSQKHLAPILNAIAVIARTHRVWTDDGEGLENFDAIVRDAHNAMDTSAATEFDDQPEQLVLPMTYEKCARMSARLRRNGFTSFAEA